MGGSFDPPHAGHINALISVQKSFSLDRIHVIPACQSPLAKAPPAAPAKERLQMLQKALKPLPFAFADEREIRRGGTSFSHTTVEEIAAERPQDHLFLIIGADQFQLWNRWKNTRRILKKAALIVTNRPGFPLPPPLNKGRFPAKAVPAEAERVNSLNNRKTISRLTKKAARRKAGPQQSDPPRFGPQRGASLRRGSTEAVLKEAIMKEAFLTEEKPVYFHSLTRKREISSFLVRQKLKEGRSVRSLVPDSVLSYIQSRKLYAAAAASRKPPPEKPAKGRFSPSRQPLYIKPV